MEVTIKVDVEALAKVTKVLKKDLKDLTNTASAVKSATQLVQAKWLEYISGVDVVYSGGKFRINRGSGMYAQAVANGLQYPYHSDKLQGAVEVNLDYVDILERGFSAFELKDKMLAGKVAMAKGYVDVPFDDEKLTDMPTVVKTNITAGRLANVRVEGALKTYDIGKRSQLLPKEFGMPAYTWKSGQYAGLTQEAGGGGGVIKFRRISSKTPDNAWVHPGVTAKPVSKALKENLEPTIKGMIVAGYEKDMSI